MEYEKIINLLDNHQLNYPHLGMHSISNQIKFRTAMITSNLSDYSYSYIHTC